MAATGRKKTFEQALQDLEKNVEKLEGGDLTLEEALAYFETGIGLIRQCESQLRTAEGKLRELLAGENGEVVERVLGADLTSLLGGEPLNE